MLLESTVIAVQRHVARCDTLRKAAEALDVPSSLLSDIRARRDGHVSVAAENRVRAALGLRPRGHRNHNPKRPWIRMADQRRMDALGATHAEVLAAGLAALERD